MKQESQMSQQNSQKQRQGTSSNYRLTPSEHASLSRAIRDANVWLLLKGRAKPEEFEGDQILLKRYNRLKQLPEEQWGLYDKEGMPLAHKYDLPDKWMDMPEELMLQAVEHYLDLEDRGQDECQIRNEWGICQTDDLDPEDPRHLM